MRDDSFLFVRVAEIRRKPLVTCGPDLDLASAARVMRQKNVSGIVVCRGGAPVGIITDRDLRNRFAEAPQDIRYFPASSAMTAPLVTIGEGELVLEAIHRMAKHGIHRLVVLDSLGEVTGVVTDTDILSLGAAGPLRFAREIEEATSLEDLRHVNRRVVELASFGTKTGARTRDVMGLISRFYDSVAARAITLLLDTEEEGLPAGFAFLALGSEGRREQTLKTDQDSALVHADDLSEPEVAALEGFSHRLIEALIRIGVPPCPGGTMANNPLWRRPVSGWIEVVKHWIAVPTPENIVNFGMFCDLRTVYGDASLEARIKDQIRDAVARNSLFLRHLARHILRFRPPLGFLGRFRVERSGEHRGMIDLKKAGIFAITEGVTALALEVGIVDGGTLGKLAVLVEKAILTGSEAAQVEEAFDHLITLRLRNQLRQVEAGVKPTNYIDPAELSESDRGKFVRALQAVGSFQNTIRGRYRIDSVPA